jgi:hypothetical protein
MPSCQLFSAQGNTYLVKNTFIDEPIDIADTDSQPTRSQSSPALTGAHPSTEDGICTQDQVWEILCTQDQVWEKPSALMVSLPLAQTEDEAEDKGEDVQSLASTAADEHSSDYVSSCEDNSWSQTSSLNERCVKAECPVQLQSTSLSHYPAANSTLPVCALPVQRDAVYQQVMCTTWPMQMLIQTCEPLHMQGRSTNANCSCGNVSLPDLPLCPECDAAGCTLMLRGIPGNFTRANLLELLDKLGFAGSYDFVYLPFDFVKKGNLGYAFVNMKSEHGEYGAQRLRHSFTGFFQWAAIAPKIKSDKVGRAGWAAKQQGLRANVDRYRNCDAMHNAVPDEFKPALFWNGARIRFPAPTKALRRPRGRNGCDAHQ